MHGVMTLSSWKISLTLTAQCRMMVDLVEKSFVRLAWPSNGLVQCKYLVLLIPVEEGLN